MPKQQMSLRSLNQLLLVACMVVGSWLGEPVQAFANDKPRYPWQVELDHWNAIKGSSNPAELRSYLDRYPNGTFAALAKALLKGLEPAEAKIMAPSPSRAKRPTPNDKAPNAAAWVTGAERLVETNFRALQGKRIGLITNHTALLWQNDKAGSGQHLVDVLHQAGNVDLIAIFVPEHGFRGTVEAGKSVRNQVDDRTGLPIRSLYGKTRKPTRTMLADIDMLVFDIQDIGVRFYTYISTMGLAMQAAADAGIPFHVLDRPNPLGGDYVSGFMLDPSERSFVGQFEIPIAHGMTVGELALLIKGERLLPRLAELQLSVGEVTGWQRSTRWPLDRPWNPTSPNINSFDAALLYPGTGLFEATAINEGRGTLVPFTVVGAEWISSRSVAANLNKLDLPGVTFEATRYTPRSIKSMAARPRLMGRRLNGIKVVITDHGSVQPVELGVALLSELRREARRLGGKRLFSKPGWLARMAGTRRLYRQLSQGRSGSQIAASWQSEVEQFKQLRAPYLLYK